MQAVRDRLTQLRDTVTAHPWISGAATAGAVGVAMAPGAIGTAAVGLGALAAANPVGLAVLGVTGAAAWAARRSLPGARTATTTMLHATPAVALTEIGNSIRSLHRGRPLSSGERGALVATLNDFQTITGTTPSRETQEKITTLIAALEALESLDDNPQLLVISEECHAAIQAIRPDLDTLLEANRGTIPAILHHFHEFLDSLMVEATPELRLAYSALNDLLSQDVPTRELAAQAYARLTQAQHVYASRGTVPPQINTALAFLSSNALIFPLTEEHQGVLRAALGHLHTTISEQSGEVEKLVDRLTYHVFGEASGLIPKARQEIAGLLCNAPSSLLNTATLLDRIRWGNRSGETIAGLIETLGAVENPSDNMSELLGLLRRAEGVDPALMRAVSDELDLRIKERQGIVWQQVSELRNEILNPDRGLVKEALDLMAPIMTQFTNYVKVAPSPLRQARDALLLLEGNPGAPAHQRAVLSALQDINSPATDELKERIAAGTADLDSIRAAKADLQMQIEEEQGEILTFVDALFNAFQGQVHHFITSTMNRAPEPLCKWNQALKHLLNGLNRNTPIAALEPLIQGVREHLPEANHPINTALNRFKEGHISRDPLKQSLQAEIQRTDTLISTMSGSLTQAFRSAVSTLQDEVDGVIQNTSHAVTAQMNAWVRAGRGLIEGAPDHPMKGLFERILDAHAPGGQALSGAIYTELGRVSLLIPQFREKVLQHIPRDNLAKDPELLISQCFRVMQEIVRDSSEEQRAIFYESIYHAARKADPLNPDIGGANWGSENAFSITNPAITFYGFAEWHKKVHHFTAHPIYQLRNKLLEDPISNEAILNALTQIPVDGFRDLVLSKLYHKLNPGSVASDWAEHHLADDPIVTLEICWQAIKETVEALSPQEQSFFYQCISEVSSKGPLDTQGEAWAREHAFDLNHKERTFAGFSWFMVKRAGGVPDVGHAPPPGVVGAQLGVGGGIANHPIFGGILQILTKVPAIGLGGVTSYIEKLLQDWISPAVATAEHGLTDEQREEVQGTISQILERLRQAHEKGSISGYISALRGAFGSLSKYPLLINGLRVGLGAPGQITSSYAREAALLQQIDALDQTQAPDDEDDSVGKWRGDVDAEKRSLEKNARFMILYTVFYEDTRFGVGKDNPRLAIDAEIKQRITAAPGTEEYDTEVERLRNELGYYNARSANHFHQIMDRVRAFPAAEQEAKFKEILFEEVSKKSKFKAFFNKMFYFLLNGILNSIIGPYLSNMITEVRQGIRGLEADKNTTRPIPPEPMQQLTSGMLAIQAAYKDWSLDTHGMHRDGRVKTVLDDPKYNQNMTPKQIHDETATTLINYFIPDTPWDLRVSFFKVGAFCSKDVAPHHPLLNKVCIVAKWIPLGLIGVILAPVWDTLRSLGTTLTTIMKRWLLKKTVIRLDVIPTLVSTAKNSLYNTSAYQLALNELLCSQVKEIWNIMDPSRVSDNEASKRYLKIAEQQPESTKQAIRALVENLFGTMQLRNIYTPEAMKAATSGKGSLTAKAREQLNSLFLPDVVDNVVKLIMVGYQSVVEKDQMERQLSQLMKTLNGAIVGASSDHQDWSAENIRQRNDTLSREIEHYKDLILSQAIQEAVDDYLTHPEQKQIKAAHERFAATKALMVGGEDVSTPFIPTFRQALTDCQATPSADNVNRARSLFKGVLQELSNSSRVLVSDVQQGRISQATANDLHTGRHKIIETLERLSEEFSATFHDNFTVTDSQFIIPRITRLVSTFDAIATNTANPLLEDDLKNAQTLIEELKSHASHSIQLKQLIQSFEASYKTAKEVTRLVLNQRKTTPTMDQIRLATQELLRQKQEAASRSPLARLTHDGVAQYYRSLEQLINTLPDPFDKQKLLTAAKSLWMQPVHAAATHSQEIINYIDRILGGQNDALQTAMGNLTTEVTNHQRLATQFNATQGSAAATGTLSLGAHLQRCQDHLRSLEETVNQLQPPPFITASVHDLKSNSTINQLICNMIFQELKVRSSQFLGMISDPIVFQQMIRQGMLLVLEKLNPPEEFAKLTRG